MYIGLAIFLVATAIILHEYAHAYEMKKYGVELESAGLGIPLPFFTIRFRNRRWFYGVPFHISPLLISAYVKPTHKAVDLMEELPYKYRADIYGAGIWANLLFGFMLLVYNVMFTSFRSFSLVIGTVAVMCLAKKILCRYIFLPVGLALLVGLFSKLFLHPNSGEAGGPVALGVMIYQEANSFHGALFIAGMISLSLAALNLLPLIPMDGGKILTAALSYFNETAELVVTYVGLLMFVYLLYQALAGDFHTLMHAHH